MSLSPVGITSPRLDSNGWMSPIRIRPSEIPKAAQATDVFFDGQKEFEIDGYVTFNLFKIILRHLLDFCVYQSEGSWIETLSMRDMCCFVFGRINLWENDGRLIGRFLDTRIFEIVVEHLSIHENCCLSPIVEYVGTFLLGGIPTKKHVFFWFPNLSHLIRIRDSAGSSWEVGPKQWGLLGFRNQRCKNNKFLGECHRHCWAAGNSPPKSTLKIQEFGNFL